MPTFRGLPGIRFVVLRLSAPGSKDSPGASATMTSSGTLFPTLLPVAEEPLDLLVDLVFLVKTGGISVFFARTRLDNRVEEGVISIASMLPPVESRAGVLPATPETVDNMTCSAVRSSGSTRSPVERS